MSQNLHSAIDTDNIDQNWITRWMMACPTPPTWRWSTSGSSSTSSSPSSSSSSTPSWRPSGWNVEKIYFMEEEKNKSNQEPGGGGAVRAQVSISQQCVQNRVSQKFKWKNESLKKFWFLMVICQSGSQCGPRESSLIFWLAGHRSGIACFKTAQRIFKLQ